MSIAREEYGRGPTGEPVSLFKLENANGTVVRLTDYGATVVAVETPDRQGQIANITLGFDSLAGLLGDHPYFGSTVGRFCNRIAKGKFSIDGEEYTLACNNGPNHLHGGVKGFSHYVWSATEFTDTNTQGVHFDLSSPDGDEGYPGTLRVRASYSLNDENELRMEFKASTTDKPTVLNLTNHTYWNLAGPSNGDVLQHRLRLAAIGYLPVNDELIPIGEVASCQGTPLDFSQERAIGDQIQQIDADPQGYDHCYVLPDANGELQLAAVVTDPASGRSMEVRTTQPGVQFYTGNFLDGSSDCGGFSQYGGFCLETQHYPDAPNQPNFPSTLLKPGQEFSATTVHRFRVAE